MRISDWSSDVCSSDLACVTTKPYFREELHGAFHDKPLAFGARQPRSVGLRFLTRGRHLIPFFHNQAPWRRRSEEHTSELQSLMRISYAVFCLKKTNYNYAQQTQQSHPRHNNMK